jgi:hypothetical protein
MGGGEHHGESAETLLSSECNVFLVAFTPFLAPESHLVGSGGQVGARARSRTPSPSSAFPSLLEDPHLWGYSDAVNERLRQSLPHSVSRVGVDLEGNQETLAFQGLTWHEEACQIDLRSVDVGLVTLVYRLRAETDTDWRRIRDSVASREAKQQLLNRSRRTIDHLLRGASDVDAESHSFPPGEPLWVQEMLVVEAGDHRPVEVLDTVACELTNSGTPLHPGGNFTTCGLRVGEEACLVVGPGGSDMRDALGRVIAAQTVVWAAAIEFDFHLADLLRSDISSDPRTPLQGAREQSLELLTVFERVQRFRTDVDVIPLHLASQDRAVWRTLTEEWSLSSQLASLDAKLGAVEHAHAHLASVMSDAQSSFLNRVVLAITTLSLATFWLSVWEFTQKRFDPFFWVSAVVVAVAVLFSVTLFSAVTWWSGRTTRGMFAERLRSRLARDT